MSHLIRIYTVFPLVFEFWIWYSLDEIFFWNFAGKNFIICFLVVKRVKVNGYVLMRSNSCQFHFCLPSKWEQTLKQMNSSSMRNLFLVNSNEIRQTHSFKNSPHFGWALTFIKAKEVTMFPLVKNYGFIPIHLKNSPAPIKGDKCIKIRVTSLGSESILC